MKDRVLIVVAHCDDELLGSGCYMQKLINDGADVFVCCMTYYAPTREENIQEKMLEIHKSMGVKKTFTAPFVALSDNNAFHLDKVQFIENVIKETGCNVIVTHSKTDLHKDHVEVHDLVMEAMRLYQRRPDLYAENCIQKVLAMEIPCASLWGEEQFKPRMFVEANEEMITKKISLVDNYDDVIRDLPHPRSHDNIFALASVRGAMCGCKYAEAFDVIFEKE